MSQITKEELEEINNLRSKLAEVISETGQTTLQINLLENDIAELKVKVNEQAKLFKELIQEEQKLVTRLSDKYGTGSINFETGEFTPDR
jgi:predicted RNase H-like nuclease (RuvC/YqgF family)